MLPRERILAALEGRPTDRVPVHHLGCSGAAASIVLGREAYVGGGIQEWREVTALWNGPEAHEQFLARSAQDAFDLNVALGHDMLRLEFWRLPVKPSKRIDEHTFQFGDPDGSWTVRQFNPATELFPIISASDRPDGPTSYADLEHTLDELAEALDAYTPDEDADYLQRVVAPHRDRYMVRTDFATTAVALYEPIWLEAVVERPDLVERLLDLQTDLAIKRLEPLADFGHELSCGGTDIASNHGPMISPTFFRRVYAPRFERLCRAYRDRGVYMIFHSDGNLWPIADDLFGPGRFDGYLEVDRRAGMDLARLREAYPHLTLIGNISSHTLDTGTEQQVIEQARDCVQTAKSMGRIIVGTSNYILPGTPPANIWAMLETIDKHR